MEPDDTLSTRESVLSPVDLLPDRLQNALLPHERADEELCPAGRLDETNDS